MAGAYEVVIAAGVECMSRVPIGASIGSGVGFPFGPGVSERYAHVGGLVSQGIAAEMIADKWGLSREALDELAAKSQERATTATSEGRFEREIVPVAVKDAHGHKTGEILQSRRRHPARDDDRDLGKLATCFQGRRQAHRRQLVADHRRRRRHPRHERGHGPLGSALGHGPAWSSSPSSASIRSPCSPGPSQPRQRCSHAPP